jgi:hypothetical protein
MLGQMSTAYDATVIAANTAANEVDTRTVIESEREIHGVRLYRWQDWIASSTPAENRREKMQKGVIAVPKIQDLKTGAK